MLAQRRSFAAEVTDKQRSVEFVLQQSLFQGNLYYIAEYYDGGKQILVGLLPGEGAEQLFYFALRPQSKYPVDKLVCANHNKPVVSKG